METGIKARIMEMPKKIRRKIIRYFIAILESEYTEMKESNIRFQIKKIGEGSYIQPALAIVGGEYISIGDNSHILTNSRLQTNYDDRFGHSQIIIGNNTGINYNVTILAGAGGDVIIEDNVAVASNVFISSGNHEVDPESVLPYGNQPYVGKKIVIKNNAWIGEKAVILGGITIGKFSIVGANSVVTKDIPDYSIAVGCPAKIVKTYDFEKKEWVRVNGREFSGNINNSACL